MRRLVDTSRWRGFFIAIFALVAIAQAAFVLHEAIDTHELDTVCEICVGHAKLGSALVSNMSLTIEFFALLFLIAATSQPNTQRRIAAVRSRSPPTL